MLKTKVIADNILNLTDARYFAALGVDYLSFKIEHISFDKIVEIKNWVEGVQILLDVNNSISPSMMESIIQLEPAGFVSSDLELVKQLENDFIDELVFLRADSLDLYKNTIVEGLSSFEDLISSPGSTTYIKGKYSQESLNRIIESNNITGIVVEGGQEEKVGLKNFEELDKIFECLED